MPSSVYTLAASNGIRPFSYAALHLVAQLGLVSVRQKMTDRTEPDFCQTENGTLQRVAYWSDRKYQLQPANHQLPARISCPLPDQGLHALRQFRADVLDAF